MMMDRLSILSLKLFHTQEELDRAGAPAGHRERNAERLAILAGAARAIWPDAWISCGREVCAGERYSSGSTDS